MRVMFIEPRVLRFPHGPGMMESPRIGVWLPFHGITRMCTYLRHVGHEVMLVETQGLHLTMTEVRQAIEEFRPQVLGLSAIVPTLPFNLAAAKFVKATDPSIVTVIGGCAPSLMADETLECCPEIDYVVVGEGERTCAELLTRLEAGATAEQLRAVQGLVFRDGGELVHTPDRPLCKNLDEFPISDWDFYSIDRGGHYFLPPWGPVEQRKKGWYLELGCGCDQECSFCSETVHWRGTWRAHSAERFAEELEVLTRKYGRETFVVVDDDFLYDTGLVEEVIIEVEKRGLKGFGLVPSCRADSALKAAKLLPELSRINVVAFMVGMEAVDDEILESVRKKSTEEVNRTAALAIQEAGIDGVWGLFVLGLPDYTPEKIREVYARIPTYGRCAPACTFLAPYPGTDIYDQVTAEGLLEVFDYSQYEIGEPVCRTRTTSRAALKSASQRAMLGLMFDRRYRAAMKAANHPLQRAVASLGTTAPLHLLESKLSWARFDRRNRRIPEEREFQRYLDEVVATTSEYNRRRAERNRAEARG